MKKKLLAIAGAMALAVTTLTTTVFAEEAASEAAEEGGNNWWIMILIYAAVILGAYFLLFRPQSKRKKKEAELRKSAQIGDEVTTIGGISGRIIAIKEESDTLVLETGTEKNKINIKRWAISTVDTPTAGSASPAQEKPKGFGGFLRKPKEEPKDNNETK